MHQHFFLLITKNSKLELRHLETKSNSQMNTKGLEKLIFTNIHLNINVKLRKDDERERKKADQVFKVA